MKSGLLVKSEDDMSDQQISCNDPVNTERPKPTFYNVQKILEAEEDEYFVASDNDSDSVSDSSHLSITDSIDMKKMVLRRFKAQLDLKQWSLYYDLRGFKKFEKKT